MAAIWYIGNANVRSISGPEWAAAGFPAMLDSRWDQSNGWSMPKASFTQGQIDLLDADDEFNIFGSDGPRPGSAMIQSPTEVASRSWVTEQLFTKLTSAIANDPNVAGAAAALAQSATNLIPIFATNTVYLAGQRVIAPNGDIVAAKVNFTSAGAYSAANWNASTQGGRIDTAESALATALFYRRALVTSEDLNTITAPGTYGITSTPIAASLINCPEGVPGNVVVFGPASGVRNQFLLPNTGGIYMRSISSSTGLFGVWQQLDQRARLIPDSTNIETFRDLGPWRIAATASASTMTNRPPIPAAPAQMTNLSYNGANATVRIWNDSIGNGVWYQAINTSGFWTDWERLGFARDYAAGHTINVQREKQGNGGTIGTGGLAVFALRIDHNMVGMMTKLLPMLQARSLPASMCHFVNQFAPDPGYTNDSSSGYGWSDVQSLVLNDGIEPWSHSWSHQDAVGARALEKEILTSRTEIETQMPKVRLKGMMIPGTTGTNWGGFTSSLADPSVWHRTEAGRLVMYNYAYANGGGGILNPLATGQSLGWQAYAVDTHTTSASAIAVMQKAQDTKTGAVIMIHPNMIDNGANISSAVLGEILDYMAAERDAGRALVLTVSGMLNADPERITRQNLVRDPGFDNAFARWAGTSGWTSAAGVASTTSGGLLQQSITLADHIYLTGSARELYVEMRATAGAVVKIRASDGTTPANWDTSRQVTLPASPNWVTIRQPLTVPATGTTVAKMEFGRVSGGAVDLRKPGLLAI